MSSLPNSLPVRDTQLIHSLVQDVSHYLDRQQHFDLLWTDLDHHIAASYIAESLGNTALITRHLQTAARLLTEIYTEYPRNRETLGFWFARPGCD